MRRSLKMALVAALFFAAAMGLATAAAPAKDDAVAVVNGVAIPQSDLLRLMVNVQLDAQQDGHRLTQEEIVAWRHKILDQLIGNELLYQEAKKARLTVDPAVVRQYVAAAKSRFPSDVEFKRALAKKQLTEEILTREVERDTLVRMYLSQRFLKAATPAEAVVRKYYDDHPDKWREVRARHILVKVDPKVPASKAAARKKIDDLAARVRKGEDFANLARQYSDCPSKERGGDLGYFIKEQMVPRFSAAAFALSPGQVSGVVETEFGYHIIKVEDKRTISYDQVKAAITKEIQDQKMEELAAAHVADLRKRARIEILLTDTPPAPAKK